MLMIMKAASGTSSLFPSASTAAKLFVTGATVGPVIDSMHNQVLLDYKVLPVQMLDGSFTSSWIVPPLLGFAYVVLGAILPRICQQIVPNQRNDDDKNSPVEVSALSPTTRAAWTAASAVLFTAGIVKLSEYLVINPNGGAINFIQAAPFESSTVLEQHLILLMTAAISEWAWTDGTVASLMVGCLATVAGPLAELPFISVGAWEYLPNVSDYVPFATTGSSFLPQVLGPLFQPELAKQVLGDNYDTLALSSITGPCYFAVTMDAIALGRFFDAMEDVVETTDNPIEKPPDSDRLLEVSSTILISSDSEDLSP